ncbi:hypothetical protein A3C87_01555 [Candidatus Kaiserbacteria bacterium RIFCSPHIGHO2_02_FULL_49_34]|uniref:Uncharacterized protein n=1 Tax=Candidatus Kaiserbacteria bacterium RIFCSPHIGHO2_02_FULL_49_34 TaxID=1798491 RepID=A0A1F6DIJ2_9BACT|nr:MAG: hypothetical protein A3C87_01555 [Candidatus Kaiserbacteria bacterium RIFCSPHIGHO2_02_FULL_49_34]
MVIVGTTILFLKKRDKDDFLNAATGKSFALLAGYLTLIIGLPTVILHNVWTADWYVLITIFGWLSLLKGVVLLGSPGMAQKFVPVYKNNAWLLNGVCIVYIALGVCLLTASM